MSVARLRVVTTAWVCALVALSSVSPASPSPSPTTSDLSATWSRERRSVGRQQTVVLHIHSAGTARSATVDLPDFGALAIPASHFATTEDRIHLE